jgi:hypothetical protein
MTPREHAVRADLGLAGERELRNLVRSGFEGLSATELRALFGSPFLTEPVIREVLERPEAMATHEIRCAVALHRNTPLHEALRLVPTLYWSDLVDVGRDTRARPQVRRAAHQALFERYEGLAVGERVAIARRAGVDLLSRVRHDPAPRVVQAMLENPRLTEGVLMPLLASGAARPDVLRAVAASERWISRYQVRRLLCRNRKTPRDVVLPLLPRLKKGDLRAIESDPGLDAGVRQRAGLLLGKSPRD